MNNERIQRVYEGKYINYLYHKSTLIVLFEIKYLKRLCMRELKMKTEIMKKIIRDLDRINAQYKDKLDKINEEKKFEVDKDELD